MSPLTKLEKTLAILLAINGASGLALWIYFFIISSAVRRLPFWFHLLMIIFTLFGLLTGLALLKYRNTRYWFLGFIFYLLQVVSIQDVFYLQSGILSFKLSLEMGNSLVSIDLIALMLAVLCLLIYVKRPKMISIAP